ncbi:hypothetical protein ACV3Q3_13050 [Clostridium perfringens]
MLKENLIDEVVEELLKILEEYDPIGDVMEEVLRILNDHSLKNYCLATENNL